VICSTCSVAVVPILALTVSLRDIVNALYAWPYCNSIAKPCCWQFTSIIKKPVFVLIDGQAGVNQGATCLPRFTRKLGVKIDVFV